MQKFWRIRELRKKKDLKNYEKKSYRIFCVFVRKEINSQFVPFWVENFRRFGK